MTHALTVKQAIREASAAFEASYSLSPRLDAELLLAEALGVSRERLYAEPERVLTAEEGMCSVFVAVDHCNCEVVGRHVCKRGDRRFRLEDVMTFLDKNR